MTLCVTIARDDEYELLKNHRHYCKAFSYEHLRVDAGQISNAKVYERWKFHLLYQQLLLVSEEDFVILAESSVAFVTPVALDILMQGHDFVVVDSANKAYFEELPIGEDGKRLNHAFAAQTNCIIARNTPDVRNRLMKYIGELHEMIFHGLPTKIDESTMLREFGWLIPQDHELNGYLICPRFNGQFKRLISC